MKHNQAELINKNGNAALCVNNLCNWTEWRQIELFNGFFERY